MQPVPVGTALGPGWRGGVGDAGDQPGSASTSPEPVSSAAMWAQGPLGGSRTGMKATHVWNRAGTRQDAGGTDPLGAQLTSCSVTDRTPHGVHVGGVPTRSPLPLLDSTE